MNTDLTTIAPLDDSELDLVGAAGSHGSLVNVNVPIAINVGVELANQTNLSLFSTATQGGSQSLTLIGLGINF